MGKGNHLETIRRRNFLIRFCGTFLSALCLPSALLTILGKHFSLTLTAWLIVCALLFSLVVNWSQLRKIQVSKISLAVPTIMQCPCDLQRTDEVGFLAKYLFGSSTIPRSNYESLRVKNPYILACLIGNDGQFLGYFDVIPLKESFATHFLAGRLTEKQITADDIFAPEEMRSCLYVYISGLAVQNPRSYVDCQCTHMLVWGLLKYLDYFYCQENRPLAFASAVTRAGEELLQSFGLPAICGAYGRVDEHPLYAISLSPEEVGRRLACLPDWSAICQLGWLSIDNGAKKATHRPRRAALQRRKIYSLPSDASSGPRPKGHAPSAVI